jgi:hypothetical protein
VNRHNLGHPNAGGVATSLQTAEKTMVDTHSFFKNLKHLLIWTEETIATMSVNHGFLRC